jgi:signal transduction histidine kinase
MAGRRALVPRAPAPVRAIVTIAAVALGLAAEATSLDKLGIGRAAADLAVGWAFAGAGIAAVARTQRGAGALLLATSVLWFAGSLWDGALYLHRAPLVLLVVALPGVRRPPLAELAIVALGCLAASDPLATSPALTIALALALAGLAAARLRAAGPPAVGAACALAAAAFGVQAAASASAAGAFSTAGDALLLAYDVVLAGVALAAIGALPSTSVRGLSVADLVVELGGTVRTAPVRDALAQALGDPSLVVAYRLGSEERYVDEQGRPVALPAAGAGRAVTHVEGDGHRVAVLAYDSAAVDDGGLADAVATAARLALANTRLRARVAIQLDELRESRRRLLDAADDERARLEQRLHDGAERRLDAFAELLARACQDARAAGDTTGAALLDSAAQELERALADVRALARGLHPRTLDARGLRAAVTELAAGSPLAVDVEIPPERFAPPVEATAYFVCAEALANVGKYARASRVRCAIDRADGSLRVVVVDDGTGGADVTAGTGLRGLADRVSALGGELRIVSPPGSGTVVTALIPVESRL